ncbi:hypothetical protein O9929_16620 [Vibrio lentus]|nr:hypothetical protein [Vibrio lentus]
MPASEGNGMYVVVQPIVGKDDTRWEYFEECCSLENNSTRRHISSRVYTNHEESGLIVGIEANVLSNSFAEQKSHLSKA